MKILSFFILAILIIANSQSTQTSEKQVIQTALVFPRALTYKYKTKLVADPDTLDFGEMQTCCTTLNDTSRQPVAMKIFPHRIVSSYMDGHLEIATKNNSTLSIRNIYPNKPAEEFSCRYTTATIFRNTRGVYVSKSAQSPGDICHGYVELYDIQASNTYIPHKIIFLPNKMILRYHDGLTVAREFDIYEGI